jgi:polar amino acid transport system substrate-binding protein
MKNIFLILFLILSLFGNEIDEVKLFTENYPPYNMKENGKLTGLSVDILVAMFNQMGSTKTIEDIQFGSWTRGYKLTSTKKNYMLFSTSRTKEREKKFKWVGPIYGANIVLLAPKSSNIKISNPSDINNYKIGVVKNDVGEQLLKKINVDKKYIKSVTGKNPLKINFNKLNKNKIDMIAYNQAVLKYYTTKNNIDLNKYEVVYSLEKNYGYYAFNNQTDEKIIKKYQDALDALKINGIYQKIIEKY